MVVPDKNPKKTQKFLHTFISCENFLATQLIKRNFF